MLTGRSATASPGLVLDDSWEVAGDGSSGYTWSNRNPLAAIGLYPDRRFDYIFSAWPRRHGVGTSDPLCAARCPRTWPGPDIRSLRAGRGPSLLSQR